MKALLLAVFMALVATVQAQDFSDLNFSKYFPSANTRAHCFKLWNFNLPVGLQVVDVLPDGLRMGLSSISVEEAVRSRLKEANIYKNHNQEGLGHKSAYLYVNVYVYDEAFALIFRYRKAVYDSSSMTISMATTWHHELLGIHESDAGFILNQLSMNTDVFIDRYLRVNQDEACSFAREQMEKQ